MRKGDYVTYECALWIVEETRRDCVLMHRENFKDDIRVINRADFELSKVMQNCFVMKGGR